MGRGAGEGVGLANTGRLTVEFAGVALGAGIVAVGDATARTATMTASNHPIGAARRGNGLFLPTHIPQIAIL